MAARRGHARAARHLILLAVPLALVPAAASSHGGIRDKNGSWSPDGRLIAFAKAGNDLDEIWVARPDGTGHRRLTRGDAQDTQPAWSPDGARIAFTSMVAGNWEIHVMDADGGNRTRLTTHPSNDTAPAWSPDGARIAYQRESELRVMAADGSEDMALTPGQSPSWSPDGGRIVFQSTRDLYVVNADGSGRRPLTNTPDRREDEPSWSPDGTSIAFAAGADYKPREIFVIDADGSNERRVTRLGGSVWHPRWSPDGSRIAFFDFPFPAAAIYLVNADGSRLTPLFGRLEFAGLTVTPKRPIAGRGVTAVLRVAGAGADATVSCRARVAGRTLRPSAKTFSQGRARCSWTLPRTATGKRLALSIAAAERGSRVTRSFASRIR